MIKDSFISEQCSICEKDMEDINEIRVDIETDNYVCIRCAIKFNLQTVEVLDY